MDILKKILFVIDNKDKKKLYLFFILTFINSLFLVAGIGLVVPFVTLLLSPEKLQTIIFLKNYSYDSAVIISVISIIAAFFAKNIFSIFLLSYQSKILFSFSYKTADKLFKSYLYAPYKFHIDRDSSNLIRNINSETSIFVNYIIGPIGTLFTDSICAVACFSFLLYYNFIFSFLLFLSFSMVLPVFSRYMHQKAEFYSELRAASWGDMTKYVIYGLGSIKDTIVNNKKDNIFNKFTQNSDLAKKATIFDNIFRNSPRMVIESFGVFTMLFFISVLIISGTSKDQVMTFLSILGVSAVQLLPSLNRIMMSISQIKYGRKSVEIIYSEIKLLEDTNNNYKNVNNKNIIFNKIIELKNINFNYGEDKFGLNNINLEIYKGQKIAFVGSSGAGKTTLVDLILGLYDDYKGDIFIDSEKLDQNNIASWQSHIGYIPQQIYLLNESIRGNISLDLSNSTNNDQKIWQALELAQLKDFVEQLPQKLDSKIGENGVKLSGGQRQRLGIARALYNDHDVLIMDEATAALDNKTEAEFMDALYNASQDRTVIMIAHRLSTIKNCDVIYMLDNGKIISHGTYQELFIDNKETENV